MGTVVLRNNIIWVLLLCYPFWVHLMMTLYQILAENDIEKRKNRRDISGGATL